ncbi:MAG TPA: glycosyltransferase [Phycisphaerales bacterium]|nr:glycosyltransferase [Phycisphaerales bacterium]
MLSFIIPAHNEEFQLPRTLSAIHDAARAVGRPYEIIVANDASTDATARVAESLGARVVSIDRRQIAAARNAGARAATGDTFFFIDADTAINEPVLRAALAALTNNHLAGGATVRFDKPYPRYVPFLLGPLNLSFRLFRLAGGCFIFCTRHAYEHIGGWDESVFAAEEVMFAKAIKQRGRFVTLRETVLTSGRKLRTYSGFEILFASFRLALNIRTGVRSRDALGLWYDPRRADPADQHLKPATDDPDRPR